MILSVLIAVAIPIVFLYLVRWLDLYASGSFRIILVCFVGGLIAFFVSVTFDSSIGGLVGWGLVSILLAPVVEEICKSLTLVYYVRRPDFTYFVDGAIYGFAAGTAFAVVENVFFLGQTVADIGLLTALSRAFSTSLMHGSASALVGISLGRLRFGHGWTRVASLVLGWAAAMSLHLTFNNIVVKTDSTLTILAAILLGLGGVALTIVFILWGLQEEKLWLRETLHLGVGVSARESAVVQRMEDLETLLAPIGEHFGKPKQKQVEEFLKLQARLGLKHKAQQMIQDEQLRARLADEVADIRRQMDKLRRSVGLYCMSYVRSILPPEATSLFELVAQRDLDRDAMEQGGVFALTTDRLKERLARAQAKRDKGMPNLPA